MFNSQVLIRGNESVFEFYVNLKLKACKLHAFLTKNPPKIRKQVLT